MENAAIISRLEELFLAVDDGNRTAIADITRVADELDAPFDNAILTMIEDNLELLIKDPKAVADDPAQRKLAEHLAAGGVGGMLLRDVLAAACRADHADFPDPAAMIGGIGVLNPDVPMADVLRRRASFGRLRVGAVVWHQPDQLGRIEELDPFSDQISIRFDRIHHFNLAQTLADCAITAEGSLPEKLYARKPGPYKPKQAAAEVDTEVAAAFHPPLADPAPVVRQLLVPKAMDDKSYATWRRGAADAKPKAKAIARTASGTRVWDQARSLEELREGLREVKEIVPDDDAVNTIRRVLDFAVDRPNSSPLFAECLGMLWHLSEDTEWLVGVIHSLRQESVAWTPIENFVEVCCGQPGRYMLPWFHASIAAHDINWFVDTVNRLPARLWSVAETAINENGGNRDLLREAVLTATRTGKASPDALLWLWNSENERNREVFSNPKAVFQALQPEVRGDFIKGRKELHQMLMDDKDFQSAMMAEGSDAGITNFVKTIRNFPLLNKGERQSLLVKIVRIFPDSRPIVEDRKKKAKRRKLPKLSSIRSVEVRRQELARIINTKIPANSRAIAHARSYGDLRENAEYKAAKDEQRYLFARRGELEKDLNEITPTDFNDVRIADTVVPGAAVDLDMEGKQVTYYLLGLWDSVPERRILSYDAPLGRMLIGNKVGDTVTTPSGELAEILAVRELPPEITDWVCQLPEEEPAP